MILKLHGAIDRTDANRDSYVITEDSYIDYLVGGDVGEQIPFTLRERMADSHFLFLGYSMRDWNLRVILNRIWGAQQLDLKSWAVQREPADAGREVEEALWRDRGDIELLYVPLDEYVGRLGGTVRRRACRERRPRDPTLPPMSASCPTARPMRASSSVETRRSDRHGQPARFAPDDPLRLERRRQDIAAQAGVVNDLRTRRPERRAARRACGVRDLRCSPPGATTRSRS